MTSNSKFVLRWEIDNASSKFATGKAESEVIRGENGFQWKAGFSRSKQTGMHDFAIACSHPVSVIWRCEADVKFELFNSTLSNYTQQIRATFNHEKPIFTMFSVNSDITNPQCGYIKGDKVIVEFHIRLTSSEVVMPEPAYLNKFSSPNEMSNVVLVIGEKKLRVSKEYLAFHSPVFAAMFFGEFTEKGKEEVEIKEVVYEELIDLFHLIFLGTMKITDRTVPHILKLADRFQMERVLDQAKLHIFESKGIDTMTKLLLADQYRFVDLKDFCLKSFTTVTKIHEMLKSPAYTTFSEGMKAAICDRMAAL